jgi:hypothetical protein
MEAPDVCGRINRAKALAEPPCGSADILHTLQLTSRPKSGKKRDVPNKIDCQQSRTLFKELLAKTDTTPLGQRATTSGSRFRHLIRFIFKTFKSPHCRRPQYFHRECVAISIKHYRIESTEPRTAQASAVDSSSSSANSFGLAASLAFGNRIDL